MKMLLVIHFFFIPITLFAQIEINHIEEYKKLIFNVQSEYTNSIGTAFIVGRNESHYFLATARHVINGSQNAVLISADGTQHKATLVAEHDVHDLALLQTPFFPLKVDTIPIVTDIAMNDEVGFVSLKDSGKVFPSRGTGIVRDVTGESLSLIMGDVELGHSGSPLFSKDGIAGIIIKNGRFIECLNIMLAMEIIEEWGDGLFADLFEERKVNRLKLVEPRTVIDKEITTLSVKGIKSDEGIKNLSHLVDGRLETMWSCSIAKGEAVDVLFTFEKLVSVSQFKIYVSDDLPELLPRGYIFATNKDKTVYAYFLAILKYKERDRNGYWIIYELPRPELATEVTLYFSPVNTSTTSYYFNEIEFYGVEL